MNRLWIWLASLNDTKRNRLGATAIVVGLSVLVVGLFIAHAGGLPDDAGYLEWFPTKTDLFGILSEPAGWIYFTIGQIIAFVGSQILMAGVALKYIAGHKLTWARAGFASFVAFFELILLWGVVPSEWLNLTQGPLGWTAQDYIFTIPGGIGVTGAFVKDAIAGGYHVNSLVVVLYFAVKVQQWGKTEAQVKESVTISPYGRPLKVSE